MSSHSDQCMPGCGSRRRIPSAPKGFVSEPKARGEVESPEGCGLVGALLVGNHATKKIHISGGTGDGRRTQPEHVLRQCSLPPHLIRSVTYSPPSSISIWHSLLSSSRACIAQRTYNGLPSDRVPPSSRGHCVHTLIGRSAETGRAALHPVTSSPCAPGTCSS